MGELPRTLDTSFNSKSSLMATDTADISEDGYNGAYDESLYATERIIKPNPGPIDNAVIDRFFDDGCLSVESLFSPTEVHDALDGLERLVREKPPGIGLQMEHWVKDSPPDDVLDGVRKFAWFSAADPRLESMVWHPEVVRIAQRILGTTEIQMIQDMALLKPPRKGREKPWHQDKAFFHYDLSAPVVGVWIALDPATQSNGCMHVIPGSHKWGPQDHFARRDWQICDDNVKTSQIAAAPLSPGSVLFFDGYLHHGTPDNQTDTRRRALQFHYAPKVIANITEEDRLAVFGAEGRGVEC